MTSGHQQPAEWAPHDSVWLAWPCAEDLWGDSLAGAQAQFAALCWGIEGERLEVLVPDAAAEAAVRAALVRVTAPVRFHRIPFGDIWMRDIGPIFVHDAEGGLAAVRFRFNGWGEKYLLPHDAEVAARVAEAAGVPRLDHGALAAEGGGLEVDGEGTLLTTRQCLLNPNRNALLDQPEIERILRAALGAERVLWVTEGLLEDHTDGHIDTIARFVAPGVVACMEPAGPGDPNGSRLLRIADEIAAMTDARGRRLRVVRVPSPGRVEDRKGKLMPASYLNFYIANASVVVPVYGAPNDDAAVAAVAALFPGRRTVGARAEVVLEGGGAFHCITQQQPSPRPAVSPAGTGTEGSHE